MGNILTGAVIALVSIWFKTYLDNKNIIKTTKRQKAIECYAIAATLVCALYPKQMLCTSLLNNKDIQLYINLGKEFPQTAMKDLKKLDLLVIEHFYPLKSEMLTITNIITDQLSYLSNIILTFRDTNETEESMKNKNREFNLLLIDACAQLSANLDNKYINKANPPCNLFYYWAETKKNVSDFFKKYP